MIIYTSNNSTLFSSPCHAIHAPPPTRQTRLLGRTRGDVPRSRSLDSHTLTIVQVDRLAAMNARRFLLTLFLMLMVFVAIFAKNAEPITEEVDEPDSPDVELENNFSPEIVGEGLMLANPEADPVDQKIEDEDSDAVVSGKDEM